ncbi:unnamed protein product [Gadus morhua 'NCC']
MPCSTCPHPAGLGRAELWLWRGCCTRSAFNFFSYTKSGRASWRTSPPEGGRIVSPSPDALDGGGPGEGPGVGELHGALRQCLGLLHCLIQREEEELGELEGEYEAMRKSVRRRLEHLVLSTCGLLSGGAEVGPDHSCTEEVDGEVGSFALKMWTYRVLLELLHWSDHAKMTLHNINAQSQDAEEDA